jgi:hypothetical protein
MIAPIDHGAIIGATRQWIDSFVVGLNLCPFAKAVLDGGRVRFVVSEARSSADLLADFRRELDHLVSVSAAEVETTLLIHPLVLEDFLEFNDFLDVAEAAIREQGLEGFVQVASFHPRYQFEDTRPGDVENYTNRSPYPMLHLLRESSIDAVSDDEERLLAIPERNIAVLRELGLAKILELMKGPRTP